MGELKTWLGCFYTFQTNPGWDLKMDGRLIVLIVLTHCETQPIKRKYSSFPCPLSALQTDAKHSPAPQVQSISEVYVWHPQDIPWQWEAGSSVGKLHPVVCCVNRSCSPVSRGANCVVRHFSSSVRCGPWLYLLTFLNPSFSCFLEECSQFSVILHEKEF